MGRISGRETQLNPEIKFKCPLCAAPFTNRDARIGPPFECPRCQRPLRISPTYRSLCGSGAAVIAYLVSALLGVRGWLLLISVVALWSPVYIVGMFFFVHLVPPRIVPDYPGDTTLIRR